MKLHLYLLLLVGLTFFASCNIPDLNKTKARFPDSTMSILPKEYLQTLGITDTSQLKFINSEVFKYRSPAAAFHYLNKYYVQIEKLDSNSNISFSKNVHFELGETENISNAWYTNITHDALTVLYKLHIPEKTGQYFFSIGGIDTKLLLKNDSLVYYHSYFKNLSFKYKQSFDNDIYFRTEDDVDGYLPLELLLLKKNKSIYLVIIASKDVRTALPNGFLYKIIQAGGSIK
jgi:hypothetical protein